jgi:hypothetical protein
MIRPLPGITLVATVFSTSVAGAAPQSPSLVQGRETHVSLSASRRDFAEVTACADPVNPGRLIVAAMYDTAGAPGAQRDGGVVAFTSGDAGATWRKTLDTRRSGETAPDPSCAFGPDGAAYLTTMVVSRQRGPIALYASHDAGVTWAAPTMLGLSGFDRPWVAVDNSASPFRGRVYVSAFVESRSPFSRGFALFTRTDTTVAPMIEQHSHYLHNGPMATLSDGTMLALLAHPTTRAQEPPTLAEPAGGWPSSPVISVVRSVDGGATMTDPVVVSSLTSQTPDKRFLLTDFIPALAVDGGSALFRDRVYAVWIDAASGGTRVMLSFSADSGRTWSPARVVSDDGSTQTAARPLDSVNPSVAVNRDGIVSVLWYDRRDNPDFGYWPRIAASLDGGETWMQSQRVSRRPMVARLDGLFAYSSRRQVAGQPNHELVFSVHNGWNFKAGDTSGLVADASGMFHPVWIDNRTGASQIWTVPVRVNGSVHRVRDVTGSTTVRLTNARFDTLTRTISIDATVETSTPLRGPISLQVTTMSSGISDQISAVAPTNGIAGVGAVWVIADSSHSLAPGEGVTRTLRFAMSPWARAGINPLAVTVRVLAADTK